MTSVRQRHGASRQGPRVGLTPESDVLIRETPGLIDGWSQMTARWRILRGTETVPARAAETPPCSIHSTNRGGRSRQRPVRKQRHRAPWRGSDDLELDRLTQSDSSADPLVFGKCRRGRRLYHQIWPSSPRKLSCTWLTVGSAGSNLMTRFRTIRHSRRIASIGFGRAMSFAGYMYAQIEGLPQHARAPGSTRYQRICPGCSAQVDAEHQSLHEGT